MKVNEIAPTQRAMNTLKMNYEENILHYSKTDLLKILRSFAKIQLNLSVNEYKVYFKTIKNSTYGNAILETEKWQVSISNDVTMKEDRRVLYKKNNDANQENYCSVNVFSASEIEKFSNKIKKLE